MTIKLPRVTAHSPLVMRYAAKLAEDPDELRLLGDTLHTTEDGVLENLAGLLNQYEQEIQGLQLLLLETNGDIDLAVTILAHLLDTSPSELLTRHSNELDKGRTSGLSKSEAIFEVLRGASNPQVPEIFLDLSSLLKVDHEEVIKKLEELAGKLYQEEDINLQVTREVENYAARAVIAARLNNLSVADLMVRHSETFRDEIEESRFFPQPQLQPMPELQRARTAVATMGGEE